MDFIEGFMEYSEGIASPPQFRKWAAITAVAGALERRVYTITTDEPAYPNIITLLVGPPATGKSKSISIVDKLWHEMEGVHLMVNNVTKAALIDSLLESARNIVVNDKHIESFHSLLVAAPEFGVFVPGHDLEFLSTLNYIWDNPREYSEKRRGLRCPDNPKGELVINKPQVNILAGAQPDFLASVLPEEAWGMGTTSRIILVYCPTPTKVPLFSPNIRDEKKFARLGAQMRRIGELFGPMSWEIDAMRAFAQWDDKELAPVPTHSKLYHWTGRRGFVTAKLCIISSAARGNDMVITKGDFERAKEWLLDAERVMPDIFRDMSGKSDKSILDELYQYVWATYARERTPVHKSALQRHLSQKVPEPRIEGMIKLSLDIGNIENKGEGFFIPRSQNIAAMGVE